jgi:predicted phage-related endonuclease
MGLTSEQLAERRSYLGGTDAAALAGVNPPAWAQPIDVYLDKLGLAPERQQSSAMRMGDLLEPIVAQLFTEATGLRQRRTSRPVRSRRWPWMGGHLDRWAEDGLPFEAKWAMGRDEWGPGLGSGTPEAPVLIPAPGDPEYQPRVPLRYAVQVQHYLAVTNRPTGYLAVLLGWGDFRWYALHRDEVMIGQLVELETRFWHDNVLAQVPPEPDGSESYGRHLRRAYANDDGLEAVATPEQQALLAALHDARQQAEAHAKLVATLEQQLQDSMGTTAKLVAPGATVTWRQNKPTLRVQWEALALELMRQLRGQLTPEWQVPPTKKAQAELVRQVARDLELASEEPGARPFRVEFTSDEEHSSDG